MPAHASTGQLCAPLMQGVRLEGEMAWSSLGFETWVQRLDRPPPTIVLLSPGRQVLSIQCCAAGANALITVNGRVATWSKAPSKPLTVFLRILHLSDRLLWYFLPGDGMI